MNILQDHFIMGNDIIIIGGYMCAIRSNISHMFYSVTRAQ